MLARGFKIARTTPLAASQSAAATVAAADVHLGYVSLTDLIQLWRGSPTPELVCRCESCGHGECSSLEKLLDKQLAAATFHV